MLAQYAPLLLMPLYWLGVIASDYYVKNVFVPKSTWVAKKWGHPYEAYLTLHIYSVLWPLFIPFMWFILDYYGWIPAPSTQEQHYSQG